MRQRLPYRVLLVEDDPGVCRSLELVLKSDGYDVTAAEDGGNANRLLQKTHPHILIYELNLPQPRGYDFLAAVRAQFPQVSVIAMSSSVGLEGKVPDGIFADAMYIKGCTGPQRLLQTLSELIQTSETIAINHKKNIGQASLQNQHANP